MDWRHGLTSGWLGCCSFSCLHVPSRHVARRRARLSARLLCAHEPFEPGLPIVTTRQLGIEKLGHHHHLSGAMLSLSSWQASVLVSHPSHPRRPQSRKASATRSNGARANDYGAATAAGQPASFGLCSFVARRMNPHIIAAGARRNLFLLCHLASLQPCGKCRVVAQEPLALCKASPPRGQSGGAHGGGRGRARGVTPRRQRSASGRCCARANHHGDLFRLAWAEATDMDRLHR